MEQTLDFIHLELLNQYRAELQYKLRDCDSELKRKLEAELLVLTEVYDYVESAVIHTPEVKVLR